MFAMVKLMRGSILKGLTVLASTAGFAPAVALGQDYRLSVQAAPQVLYEGQRTRVKVFIAPSDPIAPYACASAAFDVLASDPQWIFVTDGEIVGSDVLGIDVSLPHQPNPSNPYGVWGGIFKPQSKEPALVEIEVDPTTFSGYPSELTSSSAVCEAEGGKDFLFVNPLNVGSWLAAPGPGTTMEIQDDVMIDGRIITAENWNSVSVGATWTGSVLLDSSTTIGFDREPSSFKATVQILGAGDDVFQWDPGDGIDAVRPDARRSRIGSMTVSFDGLESGGYSAGANFSFADGSVRPVHFNLYSGQTMVASGVLNGESAYAGALVVDAVPQTIGAKVGSRLLTLQADGTYGGSTSTGDYGIWQRSFGTTLRYDQPVVAVVRGANGQPQTVTLDRIEMHGSPPSGNWRESTFSNDLYQPNLGCHVFEAEGVQHMRIIPRQRD